MAPDKYYVCIGILELAPVMFLPRVDDLFACTKSFSNSTVGLYDISPVPAKLIVYLER